MKIKKGDLVLVIKGKDRGKTGKVTSVSYKDMNIKVAGINIVKRHTKASKGKSGGIIETIAPINVSKVMILCPSCGNKPVRVGYKLLKTGGKERICKVCKGII